MLFQGNWDSRNQKAVDKILGQKFGVDRSSRELCQDAILIMSSYRQNCLWPGLIMNVTFSWVTGHELHGLNKW